MAVDVCEQAGSPFYYSTISNIQQVDLCHGHRLVGAMTSTDMQEFCQEKDIRCIIDAAHPFAENLHRTIQEVRCLAGKSQDENNVPIPVIRLERVFGDDKAGVIYCDDYAQAVEKLSAQPAQKLLALSGANTIAKLKAYWQQHPTFFRVLDRDDSRQMATQLGFPEEQLLYYKKDICHTKVLPTLDEEKSLMLQTACDAILTKESGETGGYDAKVGAALQLGLRVYVVRRPKLPAEWTYVTGRHGLRRAIEDMVPGFFPLRTGFTTGACATAAFKAALLNLLYDEMPEEVSFALPDGEGMSIPVERVQCVDARTAEAAGVEAVYMSPDCVDLFNPKVIRSTMGSIFRVPVKTADLVSVIERLKKNGMPVYGTSLQAKKSYKEIDPANAGIVIGSEANGISAAVAAATTDNVLIPMAGKVESLNAAVSAAIMMFA